MHPKHHFKYCPSCSKPTIFFQNYGAFECEECHFQLFINASAAVAAFILNEEGELLMAKRKHDPQAGTLDLPGGFVEVMEPAEDAVKREIMEELNLEVTHLEYFGSFPNEYLYKGMTYHTLDLAFVCKVKTFEGMQVNDDVADAIFIRPEKIDLNDIGLDSIRRMVLQYQKSIK
ncbi:NUDIX domain-containing protein [Limibacter armeniacum]|uniref:NUDIX hydrolase n=1 Tax=Limibacter armeniacum TaxID=466084 RepID=UPI002FE539CF